MIVLGVPTPHIFRGDSNTMLFCKGQKLTVHFGVFFGPLIVVGVNDADLSARLCGTLDRSFKKRADLGTGSRIGRVGLVANHAVVKPDLLEPSCMGKVVAPREGVPDLLVSSLAPIVTIGAEQRQVKGVKARPSIIFDGSFLANDICRRSDLG